MKEALFWESRDDRKTQCKLCQHRCLIKEDGIGVCGVRSNQGGVLHTHTYNRCVASNADPIEKKPLYHFLPGTTAYSIATAGCNFRCLHCQNVQISHVPPEGSARLGTEFPPVRVVETARTYNASTIAYTYTEPTIFLEYALDIAKRARDADLRNVFVTNGYITPEALDVIAPYLDAANIDLKFFSDKSYRDVCGARLQPVLDTIRRYWELGIWIEVTTLIIPGVNDSPEEWRQIAGFIAELSPDIPWHVSRFHPAHEMSHLSSTPEQTVLRAQQTGREAGLRHVYVGNIADDDGAATYCPGCGGAVFRRGVFGLQNNHLQAGACPSCGTPIAGVWS